MSRFLRVIPVTDAVAAAEKIAPPVKTEHVPVEQSAGRVLASDIVADSDIPGFDRSIVDGYAVRAADTAGASDAVPAILHCTGRVAMGSPDPGHTVTHGTCVYTPTGGVMPQGADAVVMVENTEEAGETVLVRRPVSSGENTLLRDDDFRQGETVLPAGRLLSPQDTGVLAACGCVSVPVAQKPVVGIISTGNELVPVSSRPGPGQIRDVNAPMLTAYLREYGCIPRIYGIVRDERESFEATIATALPECDVIIISGGSSKDDRDMTSAVIAGAGEVLVHGIAIAPGKPTIIGLIGKKPVFGLPGHPAAAFVVLITIVCPLLDRMLGLTKPRFRTTRAVLGESIPSQKGREEYIRVRCADGIAYPVFGKSGLLHTLIRSEGLIRIPSVCEGFEKGMSVEVILW
jgi:molybdopterin molybdotransferase